MTITTLRGLRRAGEISPAPGKASVPPIGGELNGLTQPHYSHLLPSNLAANGCKALLCNEEQFAKVKTTYLKADISSPTFTQPEIPVGNPSSALGNSPLLSCLTLLQKRLLLPLLSALGAIFNDDVWVSFSSAVLWGGGQTCDIASMCINSKL